jgi:hypothetical protein
MVAHVETRHHRNLKTRRLKLKTNGEKLLCPRYELHIINWMFPHKFSMAQYSMYVLFWSSPTLGTPPFYFP